MGPLAANRTSMAAIVGPGGPSMALKLAIDGQGDQLWKETTCCMIDL